MSSQSSIYSDISSDSDSDFRKRGFSDLNSNSQDSWGTLFSENNAAVNRLVKPGVSILKKSSNNEINTEMPPFPLTDAFEIVKKKGRRDSSWSNRAAIAIHDDAIKVDYDSDNSLLNDTIAPLYKNERKYKNYEGNKKANLDLIKSDAELRTQIIEMFEKYEEENPPADAVVTIDESKNTFGTAKRLFMGNTVTVAQDKIDKTKFVANIVADILFNLLKDTQPDQVKTKLETIIANPSSVNTSLTNSNGLTSRQIKHLTSAGLFEQTVNLALNKLENYNNTLWGKSAQTVNNVKAILLGFLPSWLVSSNKGGSRKLSKRRSINKRRTIKRSKKRRRSIKRRTSKRRTIKKEDKLRNFLV